MKQEVKYKKIYNFSFFVSIQIIIVRIQENIIIDIHLSQLDSPFPFSVLTSSGTFKLPVIMLAQS